MNDTTSTAGGPVKPTPEPPAVPTASTYRSGFCGPGGHHTSCRGTFGPTRCGCSCHTDPPPPTRAVVAALATGIAYATQQVRLAPRGSRWRITEVHADGDALAVLARHEVDGRTTWYSVGP